ncbi:MAG: hypothetical protein A3D28_03875, partial [Omnitrophica bacterium RIFCSPHIGHO2_02_FULL_63_14]
MAFFCSFLTPVSKAQTAQSSEASNTQWVQSVFQKGKNHYYEGDYRSAIQEWSKLNVYLDRPENVQIKRMILFFKARIPSETPPKAVAPPPAPKPEPAPKPAVVAAPVPALVPKPQAIPVAKPANLTRIPAQPVPPPPAIAPKPAPAPIVDTKALEKVLKEAAEEISQERDTLVLQATDRDKTLVERQARVQAAFEKGRAFFDKGDYGRAVKAWDALGPDLDPRSPAKHLLDETKAALAALEAARQTPSAEPVVKWAAPAGLTESLREMTRRLEEEVKQAGQKQTKDVRATAGHQAAIDEEAGEGERLFRRGRYLDAIHKWEGIESYLSEDQRMRFEAVREGYNRLEEARRRAPQAVSAPAAKTVAPAELTRVLNEADRKLREEIEVESAEQRKASAGASEKREWIDSVYEKGKFLYEDGQYREAVAVWSQMLPHLADEAQLRSLLKIIDSNVRTLEDLRVRTSAAKTAAPSAPDELVELLTQADERLKTESEKAQDVRLGAEEQAKRRTARVQSFYGKGRALYEQGRVDEALKAWNALLPDVADADKIKERLSRVRSGLDQARDAKKKAEEAVSQSGVKPPAPEELTEILERTDQTLAVQTEEAEGAVTGVRRTETERRRIIEGVFTKGRVLYSQGRIDEAVRAWEALLPEVENASGLKAMLQQVSARYQEAARTRLAAENALAEREAKLATPQEFVDLLTEAGQSLDSEAKKALTSRTESERLSAERRARLQEAFEKGRALYDQGRLDEAVKAWVKMLPELQDADQVRSRMQSIDARKEQVADARRRAEEAAARQSMKFAAPPELPELLKEAAERLKTLADDALREASQSQKSATERERWIKEIFEKGRQNYQAGHFEEAFKTWGQLAPYLENEAAIRAQIRAAEDAYRESLNARQVAEEAAGKQSAKPLSPQGLSAVLTRAAQELEKETQLARTRRQEAERVVADRGQWVEETFLKGQQLYEAGRSEEAFDVWESMIPFLKDSARTAQLLDKAQAGRRAAVESQRVAEEAAAAKDVKFETPAGFEKLLVQLNQRQVEEREAAVRETADIQKSVADHQARVNAAFEKGKQLYQKGDYAGASREWRAILPDIEGSDSVKILMESLEKNDAALIEARRSASQAVEQQTGRVAAPAELPLLLEKASQELGGEAETEKVRARELQQSMAEHKANLQGIHDKAKTLFAEGRFREAADAWSQLTPLVADGPVIRQSLDDFRRRHAEVEQTRAAADQAEASSRQTQKAPAEFLKMLSQAEKDLEAQAREDAERQARLQKELSDRQAGVLESFRKAGELYKKGDVEGALKIWEALEPQVDPSQGLLALIQKVRSSYEEAQAARGAANDFANTQYKDLKVPYADQMTALLNEMDQGLAARTQKAQEDLNQMQKTLAERQEWINATFQKGRDLYQEGRHQEALDSWETLTPHLDKTSQIRDQIARQRQALSRAVQARAEADQALS